MRYTAYDLAGCLHYSASIAQLAMQANLASLSCSYLLKINISFLPGVPYVSSSVVFPVSVGFVSSIPILVFSSSCLVSAFSVVAFFCTILGFFLPVLGLFFFSIVVLFFSVLGFFFFYVLALSSLVSCFSFLKLCYSFVYVSMKVVKETISQNKEQMKLCFFSFFLKKQTEF